eukprot:CAMPEP_0167812116 /NCGR_PEP_ID=MMETSP0112_2-20121227/1063_1 /TAXON_ID=91324 /ORGANISM="Lotharella globosa, Strain CCCM811" /LENGTH=89 /DNA_ID=CAMNT_0007710939 /DNA_START=321 /DNA_END=591 /DNA_ORIENTATION=+
MKVTTKIRIMHGGLRVANFITERSDDLPCAFFAELVLRGGTVTAGYADVPDHQNLVARHPKAREGHPVAEQPPFTNENEPVHPSEPIYP